MAFFRRFTNLFKNYLRKNAICSIFVGGKVAASRGRFESFPNH